MADQNIDTKILKKGDTLRLVLEQTFGDFANVTSVSSSIKSTTNVGVVPDSDAEALHSLTVTPDSENRKWYIVLPATASAGLEEGDYVVDVKIVTGSEVDHTDTLFVRVQNSVT